MTFIVSAKLMETKAFDEIQPKAVTFAHDSDSTLSVAHAFDSTKLNALGDIVSSDDDDDDVDWATTGQGVEIHTPPPTSTSSSAGLV